MSRFIAIVAGLVVILIAAAVALPFVIPAEVYKGRIVSLVKSQTGRDLAIGGDVGFSFFPQIAIKVENVSLSNAPWAKDRDMAAMRELRAALKIMPLFKGEVEIDSFVLVDPVIHLEVRADGTPNWQFDTGARAAPSAPAQGAGGATVKQIRLGEVSISNGTATYRNAKTGGSLAFEKIDLDLSLPSLDDPFEADGSLVWNNEKLALTLAAARPRALTQGGETPVSLALQSAKIDATYEGAVRPFDGLRFAGDVKLDVASVRALAAWLGNPLADGNGFGPLTIEGRATGGSGRYAFGNAKVSLDGMNATGNLDVVTGGQRPVVKGKLAVDRIDANAYLAPEGSTVAPTPVGNAAGSEGGWSNAPIDLSGLKAADADIALSAGEILVRKIKIGESALTLRLNNGVMNANLSRLALYEGAGSGALTLDGSAGVPKAKASFSIAGVAAEPLLTDVADMKRLQGATALNFAVQTAGASQREMVGALGGKGEVKFTNGKIKGINVAELARTALGGAITGWGSGGSQDTDFSEFGGTFTIVNGILTNDDLKLLSPLVRVTGAGKVDLPARTLNYRVAPKLAATLEGQGGASEAKGLEVPVIIEGPWSAPHFRPDLAGMLQNPQTMEQLKSLKEDGGKSLLKGLIPTRPQSTAPESTAPAAPDATQSAPSEQAPAEETAPKPEDALKKLFGG